MSPDSIAAYAQSTAATAAELERERDTARARVRELEQALAAAVSEHDELKAGLATAGDALAKAGEQLDDARAAITDTLGLPADGTGSVTVSCAAVARLRIRAHLAYGTQREADAAQARLQARTVFDASRTERDL